MDEDGIIKRIISRMLRDPDCLPMGLALMNYDIHFLNLDEDITVFRGTDTIYLNKKSKFLKARNNEEAVTFLLLHEICHIMFFHDVRRKQRDHTLWDMATDYMVNGLLLYLSRLFDENLIKYDPHKMFSGEEHFLFDPKYSSMLEEEIYDELAKTSDIISRVTQDMFSEDKNKALSKQHLNGMPRVVRSEVMLRKETIRRTDIEAIPIMGGQSSNNKEFFDEENDDEQEGIKEDVEGSSPVRPKDKDLFFELTKQQKNEIFLFKRMFEEALRGHTSMESRKFLSLLSGVKVDWKRILRDSLNRALDRSAELTWSKPRLSWLVNADRLPYLPNYTEEPRLGTVIMSIDESASMSDRTVAKAIDIICQAKNKYKKIYVIKHDVNVTWTKEYENIGPYEKKTLLERKHSGGTSHKNVFKEIMRYVRSHEGDLVSAYIGITDMESDIPKFQDLLPGFIPKIYLTNVGSLPEGIIGNVINFR
ncbi:MAG: hypothetical protein LWW97_02960 [Deltaproteobacteria bacterium]|nr:hypothetical protein [Deltaproteobacteria bacterium]